MEGTLFHPARRECLSNAQVWKDGFCPLLSASEEDEKDDEDPNESDEDETGRGDGDETERGDEDETERGDDEEVRESSDREDSITGKTSTAADIQEQKADIKIGSEEMEDDLRETPKTAELEDPVRIYYIILNHTHQKLTHYKF